MKVPKEVRKMERPDHTVVEPYQSGRYAVRTRIDRFDAKGNLLFRSGQVIGFITDKYREAGAVQRMKSIGRVDSKEYGCTNLVNSLCSGILDELCGFYESQDAEWIYCAALLRAVYPELTDCNMAKRYRHSFVSEIHPGVAMNPGNVSKMLTYLGEQFTTSERYMMSILGRMSEEDLLVLDGCLKQDNGKGLTISRSSRKTAAEKVCHHLMMYAYDPSKGEPLCSKVYPGNVPDSVAVRDFVDSLEITRGVMVADRGFRADVMKEVAEAHESLHYLVPLTKNLNIAERSGVFRFDGAIVRDDGTVRVCKREAIGEDGGKLGFWLYSYRDPRLAAKMEEEYNLSNLGHVDPDLYEAESRWFGVIILQSDLDLDPGDAYDYYDDRWGIEPLFKLHKSGIKISSTREKSDETAIGSEFVNFLATRMAAMTRNHLARFDCSKDMAFADALSELRDCVKVNKNGVWEYRLTAGTDMRFFVTVGAVTDPELVREFGPRPEPPAGERRGRGRPRGRKDSRPRTRRSVAEIEADRLRSKST